MEKKNFRFSQATVSYYFDGGFSKLNEIVDPRNTILLTDENLMADHAQRFRKYKTIVLKPGEAFKVRDTVFSVIDQMIEMEADRKTTLVGVGGGVITDITGFVASIYMRGIPFGFVPTTLLSLVDASIGGKNGIDIGAYKNMVGVIRQPSFLLHDQLFLQTLPENEWRNGFAEIIKHASIKDAAMFRELEANDLAYYRRKKKEAAALIRRNALLKTKVVQEDEYEQGNRKLLNFGHTLGHALETQYVLSHGEAISIGMAFAARLSQTLVGFKNPERVTGLLKQYGLPTRLEFDRDKVINVLKMDKKKSRDSINYVLLERIGKGIIHNISLDHIYQAL